MKIHVLSPSVADQIAAGEVVERPSSVVKELVENSIDAGSKNIEIRIAKGGKQLIEIRDDGTGMEKEDAKNCILRHATSKIKTIDDVFSLQSFGFRGEALAAISAVSHFELITRRKEDAEGTRVRVDGGTNVRLDTAAANVGTTIRITDLFYPTPARLAYLKSEETEYRSITKEIISFALANHTIGFSFFKDDKLVSGFSATKDLQDRVSHVLPKASTSFLTVDWKDANARISGFVCTAGECSATKNHQYFFVNGRRIEDFKLNYAVREAYVQSAGIEKHLHPMFVLFLEIDPILVDVNVHPRKLEVKFSEPQEMFSLVKRGVMGALAKSVSDNFSGFSFSSASNTSGKSFLQNTPRQVSAGNNFSQKLWGPVSNKSHAFSPSEDPFRVVQPFDERVVPAENVAWDSLHLIGQIDRKYIAAEVNNGIVFFDQHALHERQRFEQFWNEYKAKKFHIQKLLIPQKIQFSESEISLLHEYQKDVVHLGFKITFPTDSVLEVLEVPSIFESHDLEKIFEELSDYFQKEQIGEHSADALMRKLIEYKACRGAVKFGDVLKTEEIQKLLDDFQKTEWRNLCPHGRPNHVLLTFDELNKRFHR